MTFKNILISCDSFCRMQSVVTKKGYYIVFLITDIYVKIDTLLIFELFSTFKLQTKYDVKRFKVIKYLISHTIILYILHSHAIRLQWSIRKLLQMFSNEKHWAHDGKIDIDFFDFLWGSRRFCINIRIEVHCFVCIEKWKDIGCV